MRLDGLEPPGHHVPRHLPVHDLRVYEAHGGHTLRRHVGTRPGDEIRRILRGGVAAAGRFIDRPTAQRSVERAIGHHRREIWNWLHAPRPAARLTFVDDLAQVIGGSLSRADLARGVRDPQPVTGVRLVLAMDDTLRGGFTVVTAYPTRPRGRSLTSRPAAA